MEKIRTLTLEWIVRFFGLQGSWSWACRQMKIGRIVRPKNATGTVKYKLDDENQGRILWSFYDLEEPKWESAYIFLKDFEYTGWVILDV